MENNGRFKKGQVAWNKGTKGLMGKNWIKGLTIKTSQKVRAMGKKSGASRKGVIRKPFRINNGYKYIFTPNHPQKNRNNVVAEHRLVMEQYLERFLTRKEVVHHLNGIKTDNRIENLALMSLGEHMSHHQPELQTPQFKAHRIQRLRQLFSNSKWRSEHSRRTKLGMKAVGFNVLLP